MTPAARSDEKRPGRITLLFYLGVVMLYAGPGLLPGRILLPLDLLADTGVWKPNPAVRVPVSNHLLSDSVLQFHPWDVQIRRALRDGRFPWTNPYSGEGGPLFANPMAGLFSPFTWPRLLFGERGWAIGVLMKLLIAGLGLRRFARGLGATEPAAALSGLVYVLSGYSTLWGLAPPTNVFAFLPWLGDAAHRMLFRPSAGSALGVVGFAALATAGGHPETLAFGVFGLGVFLLLEYRSARRGGDPHQTARSLGSVALAAASGFFLLAFQLVPFWRLLAKARIVELRTGWDHAGLRAFAIAGQILPGFLGSPLAGEIDLSGVFPGSENMNMRSEAFLGVVTIAVILMAAGTLGAPFRRGLLVAALALTLAWHVPPLGWLWARTPLLRLLAPEYAACAVALFASLALGPAVAELAGSAKPFRLAASVLICGGTLLVAAGLGPVLPSAKAAISSAGRRGIERLRARGSLKQDPQVYESRFERYLEAGQATALRRVALPGLFWMLGGAALLQRRRRYALLGLAAAGELAAFGIGYLPAVVRSKVPGPAPALEDLRRLVPGPSAMIAAAGDVYPPDLATLDGLRDIRSYDLLESREWIARLSRCGYDEIARAFPEDLSAEQVTCLAGSGVRYFLSRRIPPGATRVGGGEPPAVGAYALPPGPAAPPPREGPPPGTLAGALVSLAAALGAVAVVRAGRRRFTV